MNNLKKSAIYNFLWRFAERCGAQGVSFIVSIVLARILAPEDYGLIALVTVFTNFFGVFVDSGLASALIQKKNADDLDFSSVFYFNIIWCVALYAILFACAPSVGRFYNKPELVPVIRTLGIVLVISGVKNVQQAYVSKQMQFKKFFFATLGGTVGAAIIGIWMAYNGYGVWALVVQQIFNNFVDTIILWCCVKWRPKKVFSIHRLKELFAYGWKLLASSLLDTLYNDLRSLIIGKWYSAEELAFYNKGQSWPSIVVSNINSSISSILFPIMSEEQEDKMRLKKMTRQSIMVSTFIMAPLMMGIFFTAEPLTRLILTEKWLPSVPYVRIFCLTYIFYPIHTANLNAIKAMGRSDLFLKLEIIKKVVGLLVLVSAMRYGVMAMAYSLLVTSVIGQIINSWPNKKLLEYSYLEQVRDIFPGIILAVFMGICVATVQLCGFNDFITLCIQVFMGGILYIGGAKILKLEAFICVWEVIESIRIQGRK